MRLLFVHDHRFLRGPDGAIYTHGSFPAALWERYLEHFHSITVLARDGGAFAGENLARADHPQVRFKLVSPPAFAERLGLIGGAASRALRAAVAEADGVFVRLPSDLGLLGAAAAERAGRPCLIEAVGCAFDAYANHGTRAARLYARLAMYRMRRAIGRAQFVLYVTEHWLQGRYPPRPGASTGHASNVFIETAPADSLRSRETRLAEILAGRPPVLGTVASLKTASKGLATMLDALALLKRDGAEAIDYRILGPGDPAPWRALAQDKGVGDWVRFDGSRAAGQPVLDWLDSIDLHSQPSFQEGLPRATIEAMSRGCACIGSTAGGIPELLPPERLHRPGDAAGLAAVLGRLGSDPGAIVAAAQADRSASERYQRTAIDARRAVLFEQFARSVREAAVS